MERTRRPPVRGTFPFRVPSSPRTILENLRGTMYSYCTGSDVVPDWLRGPGDLVENAFDMVSEDPDDERVGRSFAVLALGWRSAPRRNGPALARPSQSPQPSLAPLVREDQLPLVSASRNVDAKPVDFALVCRC